MITAVAAIGPLSVVGVAITAPSWWEGVIAATGYLLTLGILREWSLEGYPRRAMFALTFTGVVWACGALTLTSPVSFVPFSLVGAVLLARTRARKRWLIAFALGVAAIGVCALIFHPVTWKLAFVWVLVPALGTIFIAGVILLSENIWLLVRRLERARETEAELAVANERIRFAGDLHDIQGHTLHVIKLKAAVAEKLLRTEPARSEAELAEIRRLTDETITATKDLVYAHHQLNLLAEVENAKRLCEAAGITVRAQIEVGSTASNPLLAHTLREATTNLLRHARPSFVSIRATPTTVSVTNDGVDTDPRSLSGLARLRERLEHTGGLLTIESSPPTFTIQARTDLDLPARPPACPPEDAQ
ncbi:sensor histidine kinase [Agromyces laixinhei]|uniref:sensor histidine kinase n=1 Tax=Agromyces laixinhei TaxID=2585717 RepID=UPI00143D2FFA|nr:histidine kinase [Agromyces laixinhei]